MKTKKQTGWPINAWPKNFGKVKPKKKKKKK